MLEKFLKDWLEKEIERVSEDLLEKYPERYDLHYDDDYIDGMCVRSEEIYDEDSLYEDAKEQVLESISDMDESWERLIENQEFVNEIVNVLKGM